jgi:hypothetical protein
MRDQGCYFHTSILRGGFRVRTHCAIRLIVNEALSVLTARFEALYSPFERRQLMERLGFLCAVLERPKVKRLLSTEHFSIDGTLIEAWASMKRQDKDGRRPKEDAISGPATCAMGLHLRHGGLQFDPSP